MFDHFEARGAAPGIVNPFEHTAFDCWTLVDFDRDGDLDLVKVGPPNPSAETPAAGFFGREVRYYENVTWIDVEKRIIFVDFFLKDRNAQLC